MLNNYDNIARWYDALSHLVFGTAQKNAQLALLPCVKEGSRILIVGGGTGWILDELTKRHPAGLDITYVEISEKMISLSRKRDTGQNTVRFVNKAIEDFIPVDSFDVVITAFLFDNFSAHRAALIFSMLHTCLRPAGYWLFTDFDAVSSYRHWWQRALLSAMYIFFRFLCRVEAKQLVDMKPFFSGAAYSTVKQAELWKGFIYSAAFQKPA